MIKPSRRDLLVLLALLPTACVQRTWSQSRGTSKGSTDGEWEKAPGMLFDLWNGEYGKLAEDPLGYFERVTRLSTPSGSPVVILNNRFVPMYLLLDAKEAKRVLADQRSVEKSIFQARLRPFFGSGIIFADTSATTKRVREVLERSFKPQSTRGYLAALEKHIDDYVIALRERIGRSGGALVLNAEIEIQALFQEAMLKAAFGHSREFFTEAPWNGDEFSKLRASWNMALKETQKGSVRAFSSANVPFSEASDERDQARSMVALFFRTMLRSIEGNAEAGAAGSITRALAQLRSELPEEEIVDHLITVFGGSHETTASTFTWLIYHASQNPTAIRTLREASPDDRQGAPSEGAWAKAMAMEALRLSPPVWFPTGRDPSLERKSSSVFP
jgi:cytochrome P450